MKNKTSQSGFTLIELIAVMVILGILAAVIVPRITTLTSGAYESNVRNMYGLIKNEVTAQATKAAMSGDFLETFPNPADFTAWQTDDAVLDLWVSDYDPAAWSSIYFAGEAAKLGDNSDNDVGNGTPVVGAIAFMYHPHGKPANAGVDVHAHAASFPSEGSATSIEDIYWIVYYPRTSLDGNQKGRDLDGFVMAAAKDGGDKQLDFTIDPNGVVAADGDDEILADLSYCLCPSG